MGMRESLAAAAIAVCLSLAAAPAWAQTDTGTPPPGGEETAAPDAAAAELAARLPTELAGLSLAEHLQTAGGEELLSVMQPAEMAIITELLDAHDLPVDGLVGASAWQITADGEPFVMQAYRIAGVDAAGVTDAWIELLSLGLAEPRVSEVVLAGRSLTLVADAADPLIRALYLLPDGDILWMIVSPDEALAAEAIDAVVRPDATVTRADD